MTRICLFKRNILLFRPAAASASRRGYLCIGKSECLYLSRIVFNFNLLIRRFFVACRSLQFPDDICSRLQSHKIFRRLFLRDPFLHNFAGISFDQLQLRSCQKLLRCLGHLCNFYDHCVVSHHKTGNLRHAVCDRKINRVCQNRDSLRRLYFHQTVLPGFQPLFQMRLPSGRPFSYPFPGYFPRIFSLTFVLLCIILCPLFFQSKNSSLQHFICICQFLFYQHPVAVIDRIIPHFQDFCGFILILKLELKRRRCQHMSRRCLRLPAHIGI